jgi:hypothetical protein
MQKIETSLGSVRLWVAKRRHDGLTDGLGGSVPLAPNLHLCYTSFAFVALVSPFVFERVVGFNLRPFLFPTRFPRCLGESAKDARLPTRSPEKRVHQIAFLFKGTHL